MSNYFSRIFDGDSWNGFTDNPITNAFTDPLGSMSDSLGFSNTDQIDSALDSLDSSKSYWDTAYDNNNATLQNYLNAASGTYNGNKDLLNSVYGDSLSKYNSAVSNYENLGGYDPQSFSYSGTVEDFMSPATAMRVKAASDAITKSQANAGNMFSSDYLNALNAKAQAIASEEYDNAYDRMNTDRTATLNEWKANTEEKKNAYDSQAELYKNLVSLYGNDRSSYVTGLTENENDYLNNLGDYYSQMINNQNAYTEGMSNINTSKAQTQLSENNGVGDMLNFGLNAYNSFMAG